RTHRTTRLLRDRRHTLQVLRRRPHRRHASDGIGPDAVGRRRQPAVARSPESVDRRIGQLPDRRDAESDADDRRARLQNLAQHSVCARIMSAARPSNRVNAFMLFNDREQAVETIVRQLEERGLTTYYWRRDFREGQEWFQFETDQLKRADAVLVLLGD